MNTKNHLFEFEKKYLHNEVVSNTGYLLEKINIDELFKNQEFIIYLKEKASLQKYNLNNIVTHQCL